MNYAPSELPLCGGYHAGPLFVVRKRRMPKRYGTVMQGRLRRESEARATPPWAYRNDIRAVYMQRDAVTAKTGIQHVVDHIVPLLHPMVCGLHVEWNLRVITYDENNRKSNSYWPDMWGEQLALW